MSSSNGCSAENCFVFNIVKKFLVSLFLVQVATPQPSAADLSRINDPGVWRSHNREATLVEEGSKGFIRVNSAPGDGVIWWEQSEFSAGTIELELRGKNAVGRSFVGVAFFGQDDATYDAVYFRPFNFAIADPARRQRAIQYVSHPEHTWEKLRKESPGKFEQPVSPVPDPDRWFRARITIAAGTLSVFVNDSPTATLVVDVLARSRRGKVGLWVGNGSAGDFANLTVSADIPK